MTDVAAPEPGPKQSDWGACVGFSAIGQIVVATLACLVGCAPIAPQSPRLPCTDYTGAALRHPHITFGRYFDGTRVTDLQVGSTTVRDAICLFGEPFSSNTSTSGPYLILGWTFAEERAGSPRYTRRLLLVISAIIEALAAIGDDTTEGVPIDDDRQP